MCKYDLEKPFSIVNKSENNNNFYYFGTLQVGSFDVNSSQLLSIKTKSDFLRLLHKKIRNP